VAVGRSGAISPAPQARDPEAAPVTAAAAPTSRAGPSHAGIPGTAGRLSLSDRLPRPWLFPLIVFAATWLVILAAWYGSDAIYGHRNPWAWHFLIKDAGFYLGIAEHGYRGNSARAAFFPLFPLLIHLASYLTGGNYPVAGLIASIACGAASAVAVWALAARVCDRWVADRAVLLYCAFPGAMTFSMLYAEPLAVALSAAALLALLGRRWLLAGIIGALATAERPSMIVLIAAFGAAAIQAIWARREWRALIAPALTPLGLLAYFGYLGQLTGNYRYWFRIENKDWRQHIDWGAHTFSLLLWLNPRNAHHPLYVVLLTIMFAAAVAGLALMLAARLPLPVSLFAILTIVLAIVSSDGGTKPRFMWIAFPIFIGAAAKLPRAIYWPVLIVSAAGLAVVIGVWTHHFTGATPWPAP
jgi:hypothetical protein